MEKTLQKQGTTYFQTVKADKSDKIEVEIGDSKQPDFKPQVKIKRWDNEVNFSIRAEEKVDAQVIEDGDVVKYVTPDYEVHQYDKPDAGEDGGFEFEWVLPKKPDTNVLNATIETKELEFLKQPKITAQQKADWNWQYTADNIEGSYAVYHASKRNNIVGGKAYKTGKAFHIYRPEAVDSDGNKILCDLDIDVENKTLKVTVPQDFLDNAVYPVVVDPTFGYTSIGATQGWGTSGLVLGLRNYTPAGAGTLTQIEHYAKDASNGGLQFGIYDNSPSTKIESTTAVALNSTAAWRSKPLTASITAQAYDLCCHFQNDSGTYYHDLGGGPDGYATVAYNTWPASITWTDWATYLSIFATYTAAPTPPTADFSGTPTSGEDPLSVDFTDSSTNTPTSWSWERKTDGAYVEFSTTQSPQNVDFTEGTWDVKLTATNAGGSDAEEKLDYITVSAPASPATIYLIPRTPRNRRAKVIK